MVLTFINVLISSFFFLSTTEANLLCFGVVRLGDSL